METEKTLIERIKLGDKDSFRILVDRYSNKVFSLIISIVNNKEDAQELTQDVFVKVYFSISKFKGESGFSTWLYRIGYNTAISKLRKKERLIFKEGINELESASFKNEDIISDDFEQELLKKLLLEEDYENLNKALTTLKADEKFLLKAFYEEDLKISEIAEIVKLSPTNIKTKLFRIKQKIKERIIKK